MTRGQPAILRTAHGDGAAALLRAETPPLDEYPAVNADDTALGLAMAARRGRPFERGNAAAVGRKPALASLSVRIGAADPRYVAALRKGKRYANRRVRELTVLCGGSLSAGPCAMLAAAGRAYAASVLLNELAGEKLDAKLFATAARLADQARQAELTAVALAERESAARRALAPSVDAHAALVAALAEEPR